MRERPDAETWCARVRPRLIGALTLQMGDRDVAEELAQETLARVWARWDQVQRADSPDAWAFRVAFNLSNSHFRRLRTERLMMARLSRLPPAQAPGDIHEGATVRAALMDLTARQRAAIVARFYLDLPVAQAAAVLGCAEGTVRALTHQAMTALRERFPTAAALEVHSDG